MALEGDDLVPGEIIKRGKQRDDSERTGLTENPETHPGPGRQTVVAVDIPDIDFPDQVPEDLSDEILYLPPQPGTSSSSVPYKEPESKRPRLLATSEHPRLLASSVSHGDQKENIPPTTAPLNGEPKVNCNAVLGTNG